MFSIGRLINLVFIICTAYLFIYYATNNYSNFI